MLKKSIAILLSLFILLGSTLCFAADDDIPRPKSVDETYLNVVTPY
ncbi:MAG: hypothetical protein JEZ08_02085 [Clostridiales bacterium]|nr:hypothetical protein [Clostridiales bacterium]